MKFLEDLPKDDLRGDEANKALVKALSDYHEVSKMRNLDQESLDKCVTAISVALANSSHGGNYGIADFADSTQCIESFVQVLQECLPEERLGRMRSVC